MTTHSVEGSQNHPSTIVLNNQSRSTPIICSKPCRRCNLTLKDAAQVAGNFLFPLALAIFTIVITLHQRAESGIQREQDLVISALQREQDRNMSSMQRENDLFIAAEKRKADDLNAEIQRNMSRDQRAHELHVEEERHRDQILITYINEIALLLEANNGSLTRDPLMSTVVHAKTLVLIHQLDPKRKTLVVRFLLDAGQLTSNEFQKALDLSGSELDGIDLSSSFEDDEIKWTVSIANAYMNNALINNRTFENSSFQGTFLNNASFIGTKFDSVTFVRLSADESRFITSYMALVNIHHSSFRSSTFFESHITLSSFSMRNIFVSTNFSQCVFISTEMESNTFDQSSFVDSFFYEVSFALSSIQYANFGRSLMHNVSFASTDLAYTNFAHVQCTLCDFLASNLSFANFTDAEGLTDEDFQLAASIHGMIFPNGTIASDPSLLGNGEPKCDVPLEDDWNIERGIIRITSIYGNTSNKCIFVGTDNAVMSQYLDFGKAYLGFTTVILDARVGKSASIILTEIDRFSGKKKDHILNASSTSEGELGLIQQLGKNTNELPISVQFGIESNWCSNLYLRLGAADRVPF